MLFRPEDINKLRVPYIFIENDNSQATEALENLKGCYLLGVDLETNGVDPHNNDVLLMQISTGTQNYVFDVHHKDTYQEGSPNHTLLREILTNPNIIKIAHNALFEFKMLYSRFNFKSKPWFDTMLAELILYPRDNKENKKFNLPSLRFMCEKYLGFGLDKSVRAEFHSGYTFTGFTEQQLQYAANDSAVLLPLYNTLIKMLQENDLMRVLELETKVLEVTAVMEYLGVNLDIEKWKLDLTELEKEYKNLKSEILDLLAESSIKRSIWGKPMINLNSPTQLLKTLNKLGLNITATNAKELNRVKKQHVVVPKLLEYSKKKKLVTSYGTELLEKLNPKTHRLHATFNQLGTGSGRFSSEEPNLQNIPGNKFRDCFKPDEDGVIISADYSQQEYRTMAYLADEDQILNAYRKGYDFHSSTAALVFNTNIEEFLAAIQATKDLSPEEWDDFQKQCKHNRGIAKTVNFLANYGGGAGNLSDMLGIPKDEAQGILNNYYNRYPNLKAFMKREGDKALQLMYSETLLGRKRYYTIPDWLDDKELRWAEGRIKRQGVNHIIQGTCADMMKLAMVKVYDWLEKFGNEVYIWSVVHDEMNVCCNNTFVEEVEQIMRDSMEEAFYFFIDKSKCPIKVDINTGNYWIH